MFICLSDSNEEDEDDEEEDRSLRRVFSSWLPLLSALCVVSEPCGADRVSEDELLVAPPSKLAGFKLSELCVMRGSTSGVCEWPWNA